MSASDTPPPHPAGADPSMDDILASIRRILAEDEAADPNKAPPSTSVPEVPASRGHGDVLELNASMIVEERPALPPEPVAMTVAPPMPTPMPAPAVEVPPQAQEALVAPEAIAASAASVGALMRHLANERNLLVTRNGPSLEDVIRDEIRPLLKQWLDANLPALVERHVRAEIARVVDRSVS